MREFAKGVAQHIVGWMIVRALLDRLVKHYVANDDWDREKKDFAVKVVAELESSAIVATLKDPDAVADALLSHGVEASREDMRRAVRELFARLA